jgi:hypothetical protein
LVTVTATLEVNEPLVAVTVAVPSATALIVPSVVTVAIKSLDDFQVTALITAALSSALSGTVVTVILRVSPTLMLAVFCDVLIPVALFGATLLGLR